MVEINLGDGMVYVADEQKTCDICGRPRIHAGDRYFDHDGLDNPLCKVCAIKELAKEINLLSELVEELTEEDD